MKTTKSIDTTTLSLRSLAAVLMLLATMAALAVPAKRGPVTVTQPDGTTIEICLHGDEHFNYVTTTDGRLLEQDEAGFYRIAAPGAAPKRGRMATPKGPSRFPGGNYPTTGQRRGLVILVEFKNKKFSIGNPHEAFTRMLNEEGYADDGATGSSRDYFIDNSNGLFTPTFDVYGPVTLAHTMMYYGADADGMIDAHGYEMMTEGCTLLDGEIDFSRYDEDGDGVVDNVFVFYAGYNQAEGGGSNTVWPHTWDITEAGIELELDGKRFRTYACTSELRGTSGKRMCGIGTFTHEFCHVLGLPDLYSTNDNTAATHPGDWSVLDHGAYNNDGRTPPYLSAYERSFLHWLTPNLLTTGRHSLAPLHVGNEAFVVATDSEHDYFILENRQREGWDAYLPGDGLHLWHIDYQPQRWSDNTVNNQTGHPCVQLQDDLSLTSWSGWTAPWAISGVQSEADGTVLFAYGSEASGIQPPFGNGHLEPSSHLNDSPNGSIPQHGKGRIVVSPSLGPIIVKDGGAFNLQGQPLGGLWQ